MIDQALTIPHIDLLLVALVMAATCLTLERAARARLIDAGADARWPILATATTVLTVSLAAWGGARVLAHDLQALAGLARVSATQLELQGAGALTPGGTEDRARATQVLRALSRDAGLVTDADLPDWNRTKAGATEVTDLDRLGADVPECRTFVAGHEAGEARATAPGHQQGATHVDSGAVVYATGARAAKELDLYRDPTIVDCIRAVSLKTFQPLGVNAVSVSPVAAEGVTDGFGFLVTADLPATGAPAASLAMGVQGVRAGRALASVTVTGTPEQIAQVMSTTLPPIEQRLQAAQR